MPIPVEALKILATHAMYVQFGPDISKACGLLLFGGTNIPGAVDDEHLLEAALNQPDMSISPETALAAVTSAAKASFAANLERKASAAVSAGTLARDAVDQAISFIIEVNN
jgi:hypothetical protein